MDCPIRPVWLKNDFGPVILENSGLSCGWDFPEMDRVAGFVWFATDLVQHSISPAVIAREPGNDREAVLCKPNESAFLTVPIHVPVP